MSLTVCVAPANTVAYPNGGGHLWVYLHWALALRALGCRVIWLEGLDVDRRRPACATRSLFHYWRNRRDPCRAVPRRRPHVGAHGPAHLPPRVAVRPRGARRR